MKYKVGDLVAIKTYKELQELKKADEKAGSLLTADHMGCAGYILKVKRVIADRFYIFEDCTRAFREDMIAGIYKRGLQVGDKVVIKSHEECEKVLYQQAYKNFENNCNKVMTIKMFYKLTDLVLFEEIDLVLPLSVIKEKENKTMTTKYIIELEQPVIKADGTKLYPAKGCNSLVFDENGIEKILTPYIENLYNGKIVCVEKESERFETGKIYNIVDGSFTDVWGEVMAGIKSFADIEREYKGYFVEVK